MTILYIGSTHLKLEDLENNHRDARSKDYSMTVFRTKLEEKHTTHNKGKFRWLVKPFECNQAAIEDFEGRLIRKHLPEYNQDYFPEVSSLKYGRYNEAHAIKVRYRGVYCFEVEDEKTEIHLDHIPEGRDTQVS
jgi:hypothetical protein